MQQCGAMEVTTDASVTAQGCPQGTQPRSLAVEELGALSEADAVGFALTGADACDYI